MVVEEPHGNVIFISGNQSAKNIEPSGVSGAEHVPEALLAFVSFPAVEEEIENLLTPHSVQGTLHTPKTRHGPTLQLVQFDFRFSDGKDVLHVPCP